MGLAPYIPGLPGMRSSKNTGYRQIFRGGFVPEILPGGKLIAGDASRDPLNTTTILNLQAGMLMGKISTVVNSLGTVNYYAPSIIGITTNAEAAGSVAIEASAAVVTELVRRCGSSGTFKLTGPPSASGVVTTETVTYSAASSTNITVTAIGNAFVAGSFIQPTDGSHTPVTFIPDGYGIPVAEQDGTVLTAIQFPELPVSGIIQSGQILNWPSDTSLRAWIVARINDAAGGKFSWSHAYD